MKNNVNYQQILDKELDRIANQDPAPSLLLHACCAPCSSYCLEYLSQYFQITIYYYNPNIAPASEFDKRVSELQRFRTEYFTKHPTKNPVTVRVGHYDPQEFDAIAKGHEQDPERGERCYLCYRQRMEATAKLCKEEGFDYYTTTLSISPYKNANWINEIGASLADTYGINYLYADFKKRGGYRRSIELSAEYGLYRQNYCGCAYSKAESERKRNK